ncbi:hypothetical protein KY285_030308 [Solanum tuberosum]|nr:hypothetical protein KY285_030308 [Solanum tuberosum]
MKGSIVDTLTTLFETFTMKESESIQEMCTRFSTITNEIFYLGEPIASSKQSRKILEVLPRFMTDEVNVVYEARNVEILTINALFERLQIHEMHRNKNCLIFKGKDKIRGLLASRSERRETTGHKDKKALDLWENSSSNSNESEGSEHAYMTEAIKGNVMWKKDLVHSMMPSVMFIMRELGILISKLGPAQEKQSEAKDAEVVEASHNPSLETHMQPVDETPSKEDYFVHSHTLDLNVSHHSSHEGSVKFDAKFVSEVLVCIESQPSPLENDKDEDNDDDDKPLKWSMQRRMVSISKWKENVSYETKKKGKTYPTKSSAQKFMSNAMESNSAQTRCNRR